MIKRLRKKFVLINMILVSVILIIVFLALSVSSYQMLRMQSMQALERSIERMPDQKPPKFEIGQPQQEQFSMAPVFTVLLKNDGEIQLLFNENIEVAQADLTRLVETVTASDKSTGILSAYHLRYLTRNTPEGLKIAFTEISVENASIKSTIFRLISFCALSIAAFFCVSLFLSHWTLYPVEMAWERQKRFISDASHELKTPLTVIMANTGIIKANQNESVESQIKWVQNTETEAVRMKQLIDHMLFLAKSDEGKSIEKHCPVNLSDLAQSIALSFESVAYEQNIQLQTNIARGIYTLGDEALLKQLFAILLDNAFKYAPVNGSVTLILNEKQSRAIITVHNTGPTIDPQVLPYLFDRFYRADKSRAREKEGYGLGLSIAKSIVSSHNGKISVKSGPESGTDFTAALPLYNC